MSIHPNTYIGPYFQIHDPIKNPDLDTIICNKLFVIPSEHFDVNRTILIPNIEIKNAISIDSDYQEAEVWNLDELNVEEQKKYLENRFQEIAKNLREHYKVVKVRFGVVHYWL